MYDISRLKVKCISAVLCDRSSVCRLKQALVDSDAVSVHVLLLAQNCNISPNMTHRQDGGCPLLSQCCAVRSVPYVTLTVTRCTNCVQLL
jgi:hypothetical protein